MWYCPYCLKIIKEEYKDQCPKCYHDLTWDTIEYLDESNDAVIIDPHNTKYIQFPLKGLRIDSNGTYFSDISQYLEEKISDI